jgi:hypothetical protein
MSTASSTTYLVDEHRSVGPGGHRDCLAAQIVRALDVAIRAHNPFELWDEECVGKSDLLLTDRHIGSRATFESSQWRARSETCGLTGDSMTISEYLAATALVAVILWAVLGLLMQES